MSDSPSPTSEQPKRKGGRPRKPPDVRAALIQLLRACSYRTVACRKVGIAYSTFTHWLDNGREHPESEDGKFLAAVLEAEADAENRMVARVDRASAKNGELALKWLMVRYPERYAKHDSATLKRLAKLAEQFTANTSGQQSPPANQSTEDVV